MKEKQLAMAIANRVLDRINADPDDDLAVLARQFLRAEEALTQPIIVLPPKLYDELKNAGALTADYQWVRQENVPSAAK